MSVCIYLKKDINWRSVPLSNTCSFKDEDLVRNLGIGIREFRSTIKNVCLNRWGIPIIKNDDTNPVNRVFYTENSFAKCLDYDWIIPMDDDDDLGDLQSSIFQSTESDVIFWSAYEYDFTKGADRISPYLSKDDCPDLEVERNKIPLLPACYAISNKAAREALETQSIGSVVNFFSALKYFQSTELKLSFQSGVFATRPYTHFCEYYLYGDEIPQPKFNYKMKHEFLDIVKGIYELGKSRI